MHILLKQMHFFPRQQATKTAPLHKATVFVAQPMSFTLSPPLPAQATLTESGQSVPHCVSDPLLCPNSSRAFSRTFSCFGKSSSLEIQEFWLSELLLLLIALKILF